MGYKTIGIRVLDDSNILDRLKVAAKKHDMSYAELINYWLLLDEGKQEPAQLSLFPADPSTPELQPATEISPKIADFEARILTLEETISKLSQSLQAFIEKMNPAPVENLPEAEQESPQKPSWKLRLMELHLQGLTTRQIAAKLTEEGIPTIRGRNTAWHHATVSKLIKAYSGETPTPQEPASAEPAPKQTARRGRKPKS